MPKIGTKKLEKFFPEYLRQNFSKNFVHILGNVTTSYSHYKISWPLVRYKTWGRLWPSQNILTLTAWRSLARAYFDIGCFCFMLRKYCKKRSNLNIGLLIYVSFWCHIHYRMSKVVADHDDLLTHWRYIYMSKFITKIFLIQTTSNYILLIFSSLQNSDFQSQFSMSKIIRIFLQNFSLKNVI